MLFRSDDQLVRLTLESVVEYFLDHLDEMEIEEIDVRGDANDLSDFTPWTFYFGCKGWTRFGLEAGPNIAPDTETVQAA